MPCSHCCSHNCHHPYLEESDYFCHRPWNCDFCNCTESTLVVNSIDGFKMTMDVRHYQLGELQVKTVNDVIFVEGSQNRTEESESFRKTCIKRKFMQKYRLPRYYDSSLIAVTFSSDGVLTVKVPPPETKQFEEKSVTIELVGAHNKAKPVEEKVEVEKPVENEN